jgi:hypothetical protein
LKITPRVLKNTPKALMITFGVIDVGDKTRKRAVFPLSD